MKEGKDLEEYLSFVRHDLRSQLCIIQESVNQVRDGLGNKDCEKCFGMLKPAVESAGQMNKLIEESLSLSKFKSVMLSFSLRKEAQSKDTSPA